MIRVAFGANNTLRSRLIRWATGGTYSHVWLEYPSDVWGGSWAAHATDVGVVKEPALRVRKRYRRVRCFETHGFNITKGMAKSHDLLGRKYDFKVLWNALLLVLLRATGWQFLWRLPIQDVHKYTCSEFVATVLQRSDLGIAQGLNPEFTTPQHLLDLCVAHPLVFRE